ncbi:MULTISPECIES: PilZ domain-containing protein [unclassified Neptuniibacter]|jgi:hypothetical protein|uniref:PilZ domain-containing protein n=1 Tax=unclassified Neptuniibacter TaxID=2630693 RepID=UPI0026E44488|nr:MULTISPECIES: PilZ domain-containing protein [unclassified Neptuniibacter]MDO6512708.1 PilZ domain-containing protein [Neptuniibacter sp. 2_MG-2023]MDO6593444.1 PilZ domain-containing protein [Neptuniibacter sp. 1_MG-2023]
MPRRFIRHPTGIPIQLSIPNYNSERLSGYAPRCVQTNDISVGGLSCESSEAMSAGQAVEVEIWLNDPSFKTIGHVLWCKGDGAGYLVGIGFSDFATAYSVRMVEQVCHIEEYRQKVLDEEGRQLSSEGAAEEWIDKYAAEFPLYPC